MADDMHWRHVAATDDGSTVTVFLDGQQVAQRKHAITPQTGSGFQVGGWGDGSRCFDGWLSGVCFYHASLTAAPVGEAMAATRPTAVPPAPPSRSVLYRGPILLTWDPRLNDYRSCPQTLDASGLAEGKVVPSAAASGWLQPQMLIKFQVGGNAVRLCDFASAGLSGRDYRSWLPLTWPKAVPTAPFSRKAPCRTFLLSAALAISSGFERCQPCAAAASDDSAEVSVKLTEVRAPLSAELSGSG